MQAHSAFLKAFSLLVILAILGGLSMQLSVQPAVAQALSPSVCLAGSPDKTYFPDMSVQLRALDVRGHSVPNVNQSAFILNDAGTFPSISTLNTNPNGVGLNLYFAIDQGNRTDARVVKTVLQRFTDYFMSGTISEPGIDRVAIVTDQVNSMRDNPYLLLEPTQNKATVLKSIQALPEENTTRYPLSGFAAIREAVNLIRADGFGCSRPSLIVAVMGEDAENGSDMTSLANEALNVNAMVNILHVRHALGYNDSQRFTSFAQAANGSYYKISQDDVLDKDDHITEDFSLLDPTLYADLAAQRYLYTLQYRSISGDNGQRSLTVDTHDPPVATRNNTATYSVMLAAPVINLLSPANGAVITRSSTDTPITGGYLFDLNTLTVKFGLNWPDGYPREISNTSLSVSINSNKVDTSSPLLVQNSDGSYQFEYDLSPIQKSGDNVLSLQVQTTDELGLQAQSNPVELTIQNHVPSIPTQDMTPIIVEAVQKERWPIYVMAGIILVLIVVLFLLRRQLVRLVSAGGVVHQIVGQVRKTLVGGIRSGKYLAKLKVLDGPPELLEEELKIYTETVSLGRDPAKADFTFYANSNSSISGLHCRLERRDGSWRIVALSKSGNETFVDEVAIPFFEPVSISSGQMIRLGYYAQQPVKLEFITDLKRDGAEGDEDRRKTQVHEEDTNATTFDFRRNGNQAGETTQVDSDSIFDKYRENK